MQVYPVPVQSQLHQYMYRRCFFVLWFRCFGCHRSFRCQCNLRCFLCLACCHFRHPDHFLLFLSESLVMVAASLDVLHVVNDILSPVHSTPLVLALFLAVVRSWLLLFFPLLVRFSLVHLRLRCCFLSGSKEPWGHWEAWEPTHLEWKQQEHSLSTP